jgi:ELWxxDGT repeat protein
VDTVCVSGQPTACDDANACTDDHCAIDRGCVNTPTTAPCDDGNACTRSDQCAGGRCRGSDPIVCAAIDQCHAAGTCEPATGICSSPPLVDGAACDDGAACTVGDHCVDGRCAAGRTGVPFLVKDVRGGPKSSAPVELVAAGSRVFFRGDDGTHGRELWSSDGTPGGTALVLDLRAGSDGSAPGALVAVRDRVFFAATDAEGDRELWSSDGTAGGTRPVRNIRSAGSADPTLLIVVGDRLFFVADDGVSGRELWSSDGTEQGTAMVTDLRPGQCGATACDAAIADLARVDGKLFFTANDGTHGRELWISDGTPAGTTMIADIRPGADGSQPAFLTAHHGTLLFAADDGEHGKELWHSNGTPASTEMIADIRPGQCDDRPCSSSPSYLTSTEDALFFAVARTGLALAASSGDAPLDAVPPVPRGEHKGGSAYGSDSAPMSELWRSDGTSAGTRPVATLPGLPYVRRALQSNLVFSAGRGDQTALWHSDGTSIGTRSLASTGAVSPAWPVTLDGRVFFSATDTQRGTELWSSDGTEAGTVFVHDINPHPASPVGGSSSPASLTTNGDMLLFSADDGEHGRELWALCR